VGVGVVGVDLQHLVVGLLGDLARVLAEEQIGPRHPGLGERRLEVDRLLVGVVGELVLRQVARGLGQREQVLGLVEVEELGVVLVDRPLPQRLGVGALADRDQGQSQLAARAAVTGVGGDHRLELLAGVGVAADRAQHPGQRDLAVDGDHRLLVLAGRHRRGLGGPCSRRSPGGR
jgi:hypothetical protein